MQAASATICLTSYLYIKAEILTTPAVLSHVTGENVNTGSYSKREVQEQLSQMCCINRFYYNFLGTEGALPSILVWEPVQFSGLKIAGFLLLLLIISTFPIISV